MKPDAILSWPNDCDYPLWRAFLERERGRLGRVLIVFTEHHDGYDYRDFVTRAVGPTVECFDSPYAADRDWRDVAVNAALERSDSEWVWFTEQDFFITHPERYWSLVNGARQLAGWRDPTPRWHPSSLYVKRSVIDGTDRYFGPEPVDHFYSFGRDLDELVVDPTFLSGFRHIQGLSHNHYLTENGADAGVFKRDEFRAYLQACLDAPVPVHPTWADAATRELGERA